MEKLLLHATKNNDGFFLIPFLFGPSAFKGHMKIKIYFNMANLISDIFVLVECWTF
jgi:hypothetical protein